MAVATGAAIVGAGAAIGGLVSGVSAGRRRRRQERRQRRLQRRQALVQNIMQRRQGVRQALLQTADLSAMGQARGVASSSAIQGARGAMMSQTGANLGFPQQLGQIEARVQGIGSRIARTQEQQQTAQSMVNVGSNLFSTGLSNMPANTSGA